MTPARKRAPASADATAPATATLARLRRQIEGTDDAILALVAQRMRLAREIGRQKRRARLPVLDPAREATVVRRIAAQARELGMPGEEVRSLFWAIISLCRSEQVAARAMGRRAAR